MTRRILLIHNHPAYFVKLDHALLQERWVVQEWYQQSRLVHLPKLAQAVQASDLVYGWFASWHTFWPFVFAKLFRKPTVLLTGGYDVANCPELGYGHQRGGLKKLISSWLVQNATLRITHSNYSQNEIAQNLKVPCERIRVIYIGVPDRFGAPILVRHEKLALTVGNVDASNWLRKGQGAFVGAAPLLPDLQFVLAGTWRDETARQLKTSPNLSVTGWLEQQKLDDYFRRAAVYVQASQHESFGLAVAEAMLAGCIPVVTRAGSLPEVVGEAGVFIGQSTPAAVADGVRTALALGEYERIKARERVLDLFSLEKRRQGLWAAVESVWQ